ncbi:hypothetical protein U1Q18_007807 [Sarracenia purpurea var. burkii]
MPKAKLLTNAAKLKATTEPMYVNGIDMCTAPEPLLGANGITAMGVKTNAKPRPMPSSLLSRKSAKANDNTSVTMLSRILTKVIANVDTIKANSDVNMNGVECYIPAITSK